MIARSYDKFALICHPSKVLALILSICAIDPVAFSQCSLDIVLDIVKVNGRIEHAPRKSIVQVQLIYPKQRQKMGFAVSFPAGLFHPLQHAGLGRRSFG
jgi:hypothetical protein